MSPSSVFVSGLNFEKIRQVMYALRDDIELGQVYYSTVYLVEEFYTLIATEMRSVRRDISYWEVLAESSHWEIYLTQLHNKIYRRLFAHGKGSLLTRVSRSFSLSINGLKRIIGPPTAQDSQARQISQDEDDIDRHLAMLHADFNCLACLLALVEDSAAHLKLIHSRVNDAHVPTFSPNHNFASMQTNIPQSNTIGTINLDDHFDSAADANSETIVNPSLDDITTEQQKEGKVDNDQLSVHQNTREALINCLNHISKSFELFLKHINTNPKLKKIHLDQFSESEAAAESEDRSDALLLAKEQLSVLSVSTVLSSVSLPVSELTSAYSKAENQIFKIVKSQNNCKFYPIGLTDLRARRPSKQERHWVLNTVLTGGLCYIGYVTAKHLQDGSLQRKYTSIRDYVGALTTEHIIEPITKLGEEFFDKLHRREGIVSREDLVQSREALTRMLEDFSKHGQRSYDIRQMMRGAAFMPSGFNDSDSSTSHDNSAVNTVKTTGNPVGNSSHDVSCQNIALANETAAMESLMRTYEKQLQSPIYGMLYGNLMTAMLIQMQKLKVHTEAAMLTMDQILASNELTMAATAAMPAMVVIAGVTVMIRQALRPRASSPGQSTLTLRLAMSEVEKSLQEVYSVPTSTSTSNGSHNPSAEALNGRERVESHSPFPRSPSFHFPPSKSTRKSKKDKHASKNKEEREREREKRRLKKIERNGQEDRGWENSAGGYENQSSLLHLGLPPLDDSDCENSVVLCDDSGDEELRQMSKNAAEGKRLVSKGVLSFNLHRLRDALGALFVTSYWQEHSVYNKNKKWAMLVNRDREYRTTGRLKRILFSSDSIKTDCLPYNKLHTFSKSIFSSYFTMFYSFLSSVFFHIDPSAAIEYRAVICDLLLLSSPDFEISGVRKIATAVRMRNTYRCLIPPKVY